MSDDTDSSGAKLDLALPEYRGLLPIYTAACDALARAHRVDEAKAIRDKAEAIRVYAKQAGNFEMQNMAAGIRLRAERRAGELLADMKANGKRVAHDGARKSNRAERVDLKSLGVTPDQSSKWQRLADMPESHFETLVAAVKDKTRELTTGAVLKEHKVAVQAVERERQIAEIRATEFNPSGKFHVIIADPPWPYEYRVDDVTHRGAPPYPSMSIDQIIAYFRERIAPVAEESAILWLWTTNAFMVQAHHVAASIGFEVKTILTWAKDRMGVGQWLRGQTEHALLAVKGRPVVTLCDQTTLLQAKAREHSRKPDEFFVLVHSLCPGRVCEFFAREQRLGVTVIGAEKGMFDERRS